MRKRIWLAWVALRMSDSAGAIASTYSRPALVRATFRVVRLKRRTPRRFSRLATALPIAVGDTSRSRAAARKLPRLAMATTASSSTNPLLYIFTILWIRRHDSLYTPSQFISIIPPITLTYHHHHHPHP